MIPAGNDSRHVHNRRDLISYASLSSGANSTALPVISLFADFSSTTSHSKEELKELFKLPDEKTNKLPMCLNIYPGMWVMITENIATVRTSVESCFVICVILIICRRTDMRCLQWNNCKGAGHSV